MGVVGYSVCACLLNAETAYTEEIGKKKRGSCARYANFLVAGIEYQAPVLLLSSDRTGAFLFHLYHLTKIYGGFGRNKKQKKMRART